MADELYVNLMRRIRASRGCTAADLERVMPGLYEHVDPAPGQIVGEPLLRLMRWGLVEAYRNDERIAADVLLQESAMFFSEELRFFISPTAVALERTLGFNVAMHGTPAFGEPREGEWPEVFVAMPFDSVLTRVYTEIGAAAKELNITVGRADDVFSADAIIRDIWSAVYFARTVVADCTTRNPNVFYEIGISHTLGKDTILLSQQIDDVPFDLRHYRVILYDTTAAGLEGLRSRVAATFRELRERGPRGRRLASSR